MKSPSHEVRRIESGSSRLRCLDGIRGLAALYVVIFHVSQLCQTYAGDGRVAGRGRKLLDLLHFLLLGYGRYAVIVFIVLSGYCLMLPLVRSAQDRLSDGYWPFVKRRASRILPPYYAALGLSLLVIALVPQMRELSGRYWDAALPALEPRAIVSHLLLVQTWSPSAFRIDPPMWSVAVEWQIYFLFPLIMLPLTRRVSGLTTAFVCFAGGVGLNLVVNRFAAADHLSAWYLGLFALGAWAVSVSSGQGKSQQAWRNRVPWGVLAVCFAVLVILLTSAQRKTWEPVKWLYYFRYSTWGGEWPMDLAVGLMTACLLVYLTRKSDGPAPVQPARTRLLKCFQSPMLVGVGGFSYSLYLIHAPILSLIDAFAAELGLSPDRICVLEFATGLPVSLGLAYLFFLTFEKPFIRSERATRSAATSKGSAFVSEAGMARIG